MAVQITSDNFEQYFLRTQEQFADALEQAEGARGCEVVTDIETIKQVLSLPGVRYSANPITTPTATAQAYIQIPYSILAQALEEMQAATQDATEALEEMQAATQDATEAVGSVQTAIEGAEAATAAANTAASSADASRGLIEANESTRQSNESTRQSQESTRQSNEQSRTSTFNSDHSRAESDHSTAASDHSTAASDHSTAGTDHAQAVSDHAKVAGAENLNAQLIGMTVSITNRQGQTSSVDIGFEMYRTYPSVADMNADAANVPQGKFVIIATTDKTSTDNAKMYCKNSQGGFTFLCDLDQASSEAWAEWLDTQKPLIEAATAQAAQDHTTFISDHATASSDHTTAVSDSTRAGQDHMTAVSDHNTAVSDSSRAAQDHTRAETDHATASSDHSTASSDHTRAESDHTTASSDTSRASDDHDRAESDHTRAESESGRALSDHNTASADHAVATQDHTQAGTDHTLSVNATNNANTQANRAKGWADHAPYIADGSSDFPGDLNYWYLWDEETGLYVKSRYAKGDALHWEEMTEEEKAALADKVLDEIIWATTQTCEEIIKELN